MKILSRRRPGTRLTANGFVLRTGQEALGELESTQIDELTDHQLQSRLDAEGYLRVRDLVASPELDAARAAVRLELQVQGFLDPATSPHEARPNGRLHEKRVLPALGQLPEVRSLLKLPSLVGLFERVFAGPVCRLDHVWVRMVAPGHSTTPTLLFVR